LPDGLIGEIMNLVKVIVGDKEVSVHPEQAKILVEKGYKLAKDEKLPSNSSIAQSKIAEEKVKIPTRKQLEKKSIEELVEYYKSLTNTDPVNIGEKSQVIDSILLTLEKKVKAEKEEERKEE